MGSHLPYVTHSYAVSAQLSVVCLLGAHINFVVKASVRGELQTYPFCTFLSTAFGLHCLPLVDYHQVVLKRLKQLVTEEELAHLVTVRPWYEGPSAIHSAAGGGNVSILKQLVRAHIELTMYMDFLKYGMQLVTCMSLASLRDYCTLEVPPVDGLTDSLTFCGEYSGA